MLMKVHSYIEPVHFKLSDAMGELKVEFKDKLVQKIRSGCGALDKALNGGFPLGRVFEIFGEAGSGKTQIW